tara:strand:- start:224 stop:1267 length:1044 start_codon:yes stop_codon:yes gene_type:complete
MSSTYSSRYKVELQQTGANANTWGNNTNTNLKTVDTFTGGYLSKDVGGSADVTLTSVDGDPTSEAANKVIEFTGTLTGNIKVLIPATESNYIFFNNTSGSHTLSVCPVGHTSNTITITQGAHTIAYNNASNKVIDIFANSLGVFSIKNNLTVSSTVITAANGTIQASSYSGNGSALTGVSSIPSGTTALFYQGAAPTGWTQNTASTINDCCLRVVTGSGGGIGGSDAFSSVFTGSRTTEAKTVPYSVSSPGSLSGTSGDTTISTPTMAAHTHPSPGAARTKLPSNEQNFQAINAPGSTTGNTGGGGAHSHPVSSPFTMSGSVSTASASLSVPTMNVKHEDVIACTKD